MQKAYNGKEVEAHNERYRGGIYCCHLMGTVDGEERKKKTSL